MKKLFIVSTTLASKADAEQLANQLLEKKLIACAQVSAPITSLYRWQGQVAKEEEFLLSLKTTTNQVEVVKEFLKIHHPYDLPEIIALPVDNTTKSYLDWVYEEVEG